MTLAEFKQSLTECEPPEGLTTALTGLWWAANNQWNKAHTLVMDADGKDCAWVHAYLHRVEGDRNNADYWYGRSGVRSRTGTLAAEWSAIARQLLAAAHSNCDPTNTR